MSNLSWNEIQDRATEFASKWQGETYEKGESQSFWSDFLTIYGIDRRRHGAFFEYAIKKGSGKQGFIDMFWPGKLLAEQKSGGKDLGKAGVQAWEYLATMPDHDLPHTIVVSDFANFDVTDTETREKVSFTLADLPKHVKLFAPLIEQQSKRLAEEDPVNIKAAEAMASLHNQLYADNYQGHDLEVLLVRLVFCMFADDSGIFEQSVLLEYLMTHTNSDGTDLGPRLIQIFQVLNTPIESRQISLDEEMASLPYVNGGLFAELIQTPNFNSKMRANLIQAMTLDWSEVSPAIFGSMFQGVMDAETRRNLGAHYTSEKNILRVIKPLFLDDLYTEFATALAAGPRKKYDELRKLQTKLATLKFLDPACGAGNFLVITYRELRRLEHKIVAQLAKHADQQDMFASAGQGAGSLKVDVDQMYGIEIEEFPSLIAQAALWLTDHQMNMEYSRESGKMFKRLPLTHSATIVNANALTTDWASVIAPSELSYILGNPPFIGYQWQSKEQKETISVLFEGNKWSKSLDFVSGWYVLATKYTQANPNIQVAFVSTNSITQGEQVAILWQHLAKMGIRINFAHKTFKWSNDARGNAAVFCVIVGFASFDKPEKRIFEYPDIKSDPVEISVDNINAYLVDAPDVFLEQRRMPVCDIPKMTLGSMAKDGGNLLMSDEAKRDLLREEPAAAQWIRPFLMGNEFINNIPRWCLWLTNITPNELRALPKVMERVEKVRRMRLESPAPSTQSAAATPTLFKQLNQPSSDYLAVPRVSSERRDYIPIGYLPASTIAGDKIYTVPNATLYHFGVLTSRMHMAWVRAVCGRLKSDYSYSNSIVYNNFIWPEATEAQKAEIEKLAQAILDARAQFPESSLADLYDPLSMPPSLSKAHATLDKAVDKLYSSKPFATDTDRVTLLFEKYESNILNE